MQTVLARIQLPSDDNDKALDVINYAMLSRNDDDGSIIVGHATYNKKEDSWILDDKGNAQVIESVIGIKNKINDTHKKKIVDAIRKHYSYEEQAKKAIDDVWPLILTQSVMQPRRIVKAARSFQIDYLSAADEFLTEQPLWYDEVGNWWLYTPEKYCWERTDETDIMIAIDSVMNIEDTTKGDVQAQILRA